MEQKYLRRIMLYEHHLHTNASATAEKINKAFGSNTTSDDNVRFWFKRFDNGDTSCEDEHRSSRPVTFDETALRQQLELHPDSSTRELVTMLKRDHKTVDRHLHSMGFRRVLSRWTTHALNEHLRSVRVSHCRSLLLQAKHVDFLEQIVTGDETWIQFDNSTRSAFWLPYGVDPPTQSKPGLHMKKLMLPVFWDSEGIIFWELLKPNQTINANMYVEQLQKLAGALKEKRTNRREVKLLHDNARPHVAKLTQGQLEELGWMTLPHPPYSPDIAPSDFHLFRALKHHMRGIEFNDDKHIEMEVNFFILKVLISGREAF